MKTSEDPKISTAEKSAGPLRAFQDPELPEPPNSQEFGFRGFWFK